jgi:hypothetical protein
MNSSMALVATSWIAALRIGFDDSTALLCNYHRFPVRVSMDLR